MTRHDRLQYGALIQDVSPDLEIGAHLHYQHFSASRYLGCLKRCTKRQRQDYKKMFDNSLCSSATHTNFLPFSSYRMQKTIAKEEGGDAKNAQITQRREHCQRMPVPAVEQENAWKKWSNKIFSILKNREQDKQDLFAIRSRPERAAQTSPTCGPAPA